MKFRGNLLVTNKNTKKKLELLKSISKDALIEGVTSIQGVDDRLNNVDDYSPSVFFPLNELNRPLLFFKEFQDALLEARSSQALGAEYISTLINLQEETYSGIKSLIHDWFAVEQSMQQVISYEKYLNRSVGSTMSIIPLSFFISEEKKISSTSSKCYTTMNNQLVLPIEDQEIFPIRKVSFQSYSESKDGSLNEKIRQGPFLFRATENIEREDIEILFELEQEEQANHIRIPCSLPLPIHIKSIQLLDSSDRQTRLFERDELSALLGRNPASLELLFPLTPIKRVRVKFLDKLDTVKMKLVEKTSLSYIEAHLASQMAGTLELLNARGQVHVASLDSLLHDAFASFQTSLVKQKDNEIEAWVGTFGGILEVSRSSFEESGNFNTQIYRGKNVKTTSLRGSGFLMNNSGDLVGMDSVLASDSPSTFVDFTVIKSNLDENRKLLSRSFAPHPLSRPFSGTRLEFITTNNSSDPKEVATNGLQTYTLNMEPENINNVTFYTPTLEGLREVFGNVFLNAQTGSTQVLMNNYLIEDVIAEYELKKIESPSLGVFTEYRPFFLSSIGSVFYKPASNNLKSCEIHVALDFHRASFSKYITPIIDNLTVILGHDCNKKVDM